MYLYIIRAGQATKGRSSYKIGLSTGTGTSETLQSSNHERLYTVAEFHFSSESVARTMEKILHRKLHDRRMGDGWFSLNIWEFCTIFGYLIITHGEYACPLSASL